MAFTRPSDRGGRLALWDGLDQDDTTISAAARVDGERAVLIDTETGCDAEHGAHGKHCKHGQHCKRDGRG